MPERYVNVDRETPMFLPPDLREWVADMPVDFVANVRRVVALLQSWTLVCGVFLGLAASALFFRAFGAEDPSGPNQWRIKPRAQALGKRHKQTSSSEGARQPEGC
jgi:hypothetical protein